MGKVTLTLVSQEATAVPKSRGPAHTCSSIRVALLLFLFLNCVYLLTSTGRVRSMDEIDSVLQADSLLLRHTTAIPQVVNSSILGFGKTDRHGIQRSAWPAGHALLVLPWHALGHYLLAKLPGITPDNADLAFTAATCWSSATFSALAVAAYFLLVLGLGLDPQSSLACSLLLGFSTPVFVYSGWLYSEPASVAIFLIAALLLFGPGKPIPLSHLLFASLLLAFSIHVRPNNMVTVFVFLGAAFVLDRSNGEAKFRYRTTAVLVAMVAASGTLYLARNYAFFGNPFDFGVPATDVTGKELESWHNPVWKGVFGFLFSPGKSAILFCPAIILGIIGLPLLWQRNRPLAVLCGTAPLVNLFFFSFRTQWEGGYCYGPRYLVVSLALLTVPVAALFLTPPRWLRPAFWAVAITGFLVQAIGLSTNVLEDMIRNHYYDGHWDYRMSYSPITGQLRLMWKYLHHHPQHLGLGWDRWFVFLRSAGVNPRPLIGLVLLFLLGAAIFGHQTWRAVQKCQYASSPLTCRQIFVGSTESTSG